MRLSLERNVDILTSLSDVNVNAIFSIYKLFCY